jgi:gliotoxin biosynthesis cytochrome P450 monooxygenase
MSTAVWKPFVRLYEQCAVLHGSMSALRLSKRELVFLSIRKFFYEIRIFLEDPKQSWQEFSSIVQICIIILSVFLVAVTIDKVRAYFRSLRRLGLPVLKAPKGVHRWDYEAMLKLGSRLYPDTPYIVSYVGYEYVVYPSFCFDEVKRLTPSKASAVNWFTEVMFQGWQFLGRDSSALHKTLAVDLPRALPGRVQQCQAEAKVACETALGASTEWKAFRLFSTMSQIVVTSNSVGLAGPELGRNKKWQSSVQKLPMTVMVAIFICHSVPKVLRPFVALFALLPAKALCSYMTRLVHPIASVDFEKYIEASDEKEQEFIEEKLVNHFPMAKWLLSRYLPEERTLDQVKHDFILASFHSTPSISATLYCMMSELVVRPGLVQELRQELSEVLMVSPSTRNKAFSLCINRHRCIRCVATV